MFLILSFGLLPLGLIAILASLQGARQNEIDHRQSVEARVQLKAQRINSALSRIVLTIRAASGPIRLTGGDSEACRTTLRRLERQQANEGRFALYGRGNEVACASAGFAARAVARPRPGTRAVISLTRDGEALRFALFDERGGLEGVGELPRHRMGEIAELPGTRTEYDLILSQPGRRMIVHEGFEDGPLIRTVDADASVLAGRFRLHIHTGAAPLSAAELLMTLLPIFMWLGAGLIGWLIVDRLLLKPLVRMQRAVSSYQPGDRSFDLPPLATPAREIRELGLAFDRVTRTVARHEAELEAALERQTRLVREVHHRVKNNLQVVASLLNLHARGAKGDDVSAAYASIQRRVDALAVVHRNHYAELEENRGVALKPLISELGANLRASAPAAAAHMQIRLDVEPYYVTQDVAVSLAFLITELVELAMFCGAANVTISLRGKSEKLARLCIESESLRSEAECDEQVFARFDRIVTGLGRQLRTGIDRDVDSGCYALDVVVVDKAER
ncbi:MAG TPA: histidine kinase dimerization/phosphoacceptor domain -containing protein [Allosphingosinicella sp.]